MKVEDITKQYGDFLRHSQTGVVIYWGTGRSGKTGKMWADLEEHFDDRNVAMFRYPPELLTPIGDERYRSVQTIGKIEIGDVAVFDDVALYLMARNWTSGESKVFVQWLSIISHKDVVVLMSVQSLRLLDVLVFEPQAVTLVQKFVEYESIPLERDEYQAKAIIGNLALESFKFEAFKRNSQDWKQYSYVHRFSGVCRSFLVPWWSDKYSKPYREVQIDGS